MPEPQVRSVLNLNGFPNLRHTPLNWHTIPLIDGEGNSVEHLCGAVSLLARLHADHAPVMVQCAEGVSRAVFVTTLYLAWSHAQPFEAAFSRVKQRRPIAQIDHGLL